MKKAVLSLLFVVLSLTLLWGCNNKSHTNPLVYENKQYNFSLELPKSWDGKYKVDEKGDNILFISKANQSTGGVVFQISIWNKAEWDKNGEEQAKTLRLVKIGEKGDKVYVFNTPTDVEYVNDDETKKNEYLTMWNDTESIKSSFK
jgi:hypothetical protein